MADWMPGVMISNAAGQGGYGIPAGGMVPNAVVIHTIEGWQATMVRPDWSSNSYHFTVRLDGRVVQHVGIRTPAWHAGRIDSQVPRWRLWRPNVNPNTHTIGISAEGRALQTTDNVPNAWTEAQVVSAIRILQWIGSETSINWNADTLTEHSEIAVTSRADPGPRWPKVRVLATLQPPVPAPEHPALAHVRAAEAELAEARRLLGG